MAEAVFEPSVLWLTVVPTEAALDGLLLPLSDWRDCERGCSPDGRRVENGMFAVDSAWRAYFRRQASHRSMCPDINCGRVVWKHGVVFLSDELLPLETERMVGVVLSLVLESPRPEGVPGREVAGVL
ncbi:hypothetical protein H4S06_006687, partial [Coemansia sp. BCRC 34490]